MAKLFYPKLSYEVVGALYEVYNTMGSGYQEKYYQKALAKELGERNIKFEEQLPVRLYYKGEKLGIYYFDFLIENKIILEIKNSSKFYPRDIKQVLGYLRAKNIDLGMLACFSKNGLIYKRILKGD
ncbi:MAG: GxxExxY protein [Candidatus Moranbacteria bacterium]|jgi:GxxExxY protein|nr:GxxExxY protein [Candidatus Moranbacteria bacterium]